MGMVEKVSRETNIQFERDVPEPGRRRVRDWSKVIGTIRKLEDEENIVIQQLSIEKADLAKENADLVRALAEAREELHRYRLQDRIRDADLTLQQRDALMLEG